MLGELPLEYNHEIRTETLFQLCIALASEGLATPEVWQASNGSCLSFVQRALLSSLGQEFWELAQRNGEYHLSITDNPDGVGSGDLGDGKLAVLIECTGCCYLKAGAALDALEAEDEGLGAAFYRRLTLCLYRVVRVYDHTDALDYVAMVKGNAMDEGEDVDNYDLPNVETAIPGYIRKSFRARSRKSRIKMRRVLERNRNGAYGPWIERLRQIERLARLYPRQGHDLEEQEIYESATLPFLLISFKQEDAIVACFSEEGRSMMEVSSEPALSVVFSPSDPQDVKRALRLVRRFLALSRELFLLIEEIEELC